MEDTFLTLQDVMVRLQVTYNTLNRYIHNGIIPVVRVTRNKRFIRQEDLDKFIREHTGVYKQ
jgi:excisionase family DNA binding protein